LKTCQGLADERVGPKESSLLDAQLASLEPFLVTILETFLGQWVLEVRNRTVDWEGISGKEDRVRWGGGVADTRRVRI
jgi:hypothetical protein